MDKKSKLSLYIVINKNKNKIQSCEKIKNIAIERRKKS